MRMLSVMIYCFTVLWSSIWEPNFEKALETAKEKNELVLLNFSGSDWCGPCIRMRNEIFDDATFKAMADTSIIMVNADFPRNKKNQLDKKLKAQNESLADRYNPEGKFPFTLLLNGKGEIVKAWDGLPNETAPQFAAEIKKICDDNR
jgi:thiol-disulfide isomerase/thioredoxin